MATLAALLVSLVALLHVGFLVLEIFLWDHPVGRRLFRMTPEYAARSAGLAANQGLYNGFLAAGLGWGLVAGRQDVTLFFLACVLVAGLFGGFSVARTILYWQALPAAVALVAVWLAR